MTVYPKPHDYKWLIKYIYRRIFKLPWRKPDFVYDGDWGFWWKEKIVFAFHPDDDFIGFLEYQEKSIKMTYECLYDPYCFDVHSDVFAAYRKWLEDKIEKELLGG